MVVLNLIKLTRLTITWSYYPLLLRSHVFASWLDCSEGRYLVNISVWLSFCVLTIIFLSVFGDIVYIIHMVSPPLRCSLRGCNTLPIETWSFSMPSPKDHFQWIQPWEIVVAYSYFVLFCFDFSFSAHLDCLPLGLLPRLGGGE